MPVDPSQPRQILVVHGVQSGTDAEIKSDAMIRALVRKHLNGIPIHFDASMYGYENLNDAARGKLQALLRLVVDALARQIPLGNVVVGAVHSALDMVEDVVLALQNDTTAAQIRAGLRARILETYLSDHAPPLYLVAHSLGTVYALDVVNELIRTRPHGVFDRDRRKTWPVQGLVTLGSPLGLSMFSRGRALAPFGPGRKWFRWFNYWCRTDPVVSGSFYGQPVDGYAIAERFPRAAGWIVHDRVLDPGVAWLPAHSAYWSHSPLGDDLVTFISS